MIKHQNLPKLILFVAVILTTVCFACQSSENAAINENAAASATPEKRKDEFQEAFNSVKVGGFDFIFVFRRPDGAPLTSEDKIYLKDNSSPYTNRWNLTDDGKTVIAGSNYKFTPENLEALKKRFIVEDHSEMKPDATAAANNNSNNKNTNSNAK